MTTGRDTTTATMVRRRLIIITIPIILGITIPEAGVDTMALIIYPAVFPSQALDSSLERVEIGDIVTDCEIQDTHTERAIRTSRGFGSNEGGRPCELAPGGAAVFPAPAGFSGYGVRNGGAPIGGRGRTRSPCA